MLTRNQNKILIALGSNVSVNLTESLAVVAESIQLLSNKTIEISSKSKYYQTPAFPNGAGPNFINCVLAAETELAPEQLLERFHEIEAILGRTRNKRWEQRVIDIDLLNYENLIQPNEKIVSDWIGMALPDQMEQTPSQLILPHPRIQDRAFVLVPMADVAPEWCHPMLGHTTLQMRDALPAELIDEVRQYLIEI